MSGKLAGAVTRAVRAHIKRGPGATRPNLIVCGAPRCGTSSLLHYLREHPEIAMVSERDFEAIGGQSVGFPFNSPFFGHSHRAEDLGAYELACRRLAHRHAYILAPVRYAIYWPHVMHSIAEHLPETKILFILRNPIDRAFSTYAHNPPADSTVTFEQHIRLRDANPDDLREWASRGAWGKVLQNESLGILERGIYAPAIKRFCDRFSRERVLVLSTNEMATNAQAMLDRVVDFLGLKAGFRFARAGEVKGASKKRDPMQPLTREILSAYFAEFNAQLFEFLGWPSDLWR